MIIESKNFTPLMWITVGLLLLGVILLVWAWRMTLRKNQECRDCGYDLTGIPEEAATRSQSPFRSSRSQSPSCDN